MIGLLLSQKNAAMSRPCWVCSSQMHLFSVYRLVQVKPPKFSPLRIPLAISSQRVSVQYHSDRHDEWKRVTRPFFFRPRAVSRSETHIDQQQTFNFKNIQAFSQRGRRKNKLRRILNDRFGRRTPRHVCSFFRAKYRLSELPVFNIKQTLAKELDSTINQGIGRK